MIKQRMKGFNLLTLAQYNNLTEQDKKQYFNLVRGLDIYASKTDLQNYYTKSEIDQMISIGLKIEVVEELPTEDIRTDTIYLVPKAGEGNNNHYEYIYLESIQDWEKIGETDIDLTNYYNKTETDTKLDKKLDKQQNIADAGKVLGIDEAGLVVPVEQSGGGGESQTTPYLAGTVEYSGFISQWAPKAKEKLNGNDVYLITELDTDVFDGAYFKALVDSDISSGTDHWQESELFSYSFDYNWLENIWQDYLDIESGPHLEFAEDYYFDENLLEIVPIGKYTISDMSDFEIGREYIVIRNFPGFPFENMVIKFTLEEYDVNSNFAVGYQNATRFSQSVEVLHYKKNDYIMINSKGAKISVLSGVNIDSQQHEPERQYNMSDFIGTIRDGGYVETIQSDYTYDGLIDYYRGEEYDNKYFIAVEDGSFSVDGGGSGGDEYYILEPVWNEILNDSEAYNYIIGLGSTEFYDGYHLDEYKGEIFMEGNMYTLDTLQPNKLYFTLDNIGRLVEFSFMEIDIDNETITHLNLHIFELLLEGGNGGDIVEFNKGDYVFISYRYGIEDYYVMKVGSTGGGGQPQLPQLSNFIGTINSNGDIVDTVSQFEYLKFSNISHISTDRSNYFLAIESGSINTGGAGGGWVLEEGFEHTTLHGVEAYDFLFSEIEMMFEDIMFYTDFGGLNEEGILVGYDEIEDISLLTGYNYIYAIYNHPEDPSGSIILHVEFEVGAIEGQIHSLHVWGEVPVNQGGGTSITISWNKGDIVSYIGNPEMYQVIETFIGSDGGSGAYALKERHKVTFLYNEMPGLQDQYEIIDGEFIGDGWVSNLDLEVGKNYFQALNEKAYNIFEIISNDTVAEEIVVAREQWVKI